MVLIIVSILITLIFIVFVVCISKDRLFTLFGCVLITTSSICLGGGIENYRLSSIVNENKDNLKPDATYIVLKDDTIKSENVVILKTISK